MSTSTQNPASPPTTSDRLDLLKGTPNVAPAGMARIKYDGTLGLMSSLDGSAFTTIGVMSIVDTQVLSGEATTVTFTVGDSDSEFLLVTAQIVGGSGGIALVTLRPNGLTTNQATAFIANGAPGPSATLLVGATSAAGAASAFSATLFPRTGAGGRPGTSVGYYNDGNNQTFTSGFNWNAQTALTSIDIVAGASNSFGVGSRFSLFKARGAV